MTEPNAGRWRHLLHWGRSALDLLAPRVCCACGRSCGDSCMCPACLVALSAQAARTCCPCCGAGLGENIAPDASGCPQCPTPAHRYERVMRLGDYESPLSAAIVELKFHRRGRCAALLGELLAQVVANAPLAFRPDIVCPVPLHWSRRLGRGYNQAELIASRLAGGLGLPLGRELVRTRNTPPQVRLSRTARIANIRGAFAAPSPRRLDGLSVLLVDDVTTTGATANEAAATLLRAGAARVLLAVAAKAEARPVEPAPR